MLEIVDTHVHLFDLTHKELTWSWLQPNSAEGRLGNIDGIKSLRYEAENLKAESRFAGVSKFVHVQAAIGSTDPVKETEWLAEMSHRTGLPSAMVGHVDLASAGAIGTIDRHLNYKEFKGVRDFAVEKMAVNQDLNSDFENALNYLAKYVLVLDLDCSWQNMKHAARMAKRHPELKIVIEHIGIPSSTAEGYFSNWKQGMRELASLPNFYCKISGVGMMDPIFTEDSVRAWVDYCIEIFGPERCMLGSNWPLDRLFSSYDAVMNIYRSILAKYSESEQKSIFSETATFVYQL